jgi:hypothetical protein
LVHRRRAHPSIEQPSFLQEDTRLSGWDQRVFPVVRLDELTQNAELDTSLLFSWDVLNKFAAIFNRSNWAQSFSFREFLSCINCDLDSISKESLLFHEIMRSVTEVLYTFSKRIKKVSNISGKSKIDLLSDLKPSSDLLPDEAITLMTWPCHLSTVRVTAFILLILSANV